MMRQLQRLVLVCLFSLPVLVSGYGTATKAQGPAGSPTIVHTPPPMVAPSPIAQPAVALPVHLLIPAVALDTGIEEVGIAANGDLATPMQHPWDDTGWYLHGPRPGEEGSAVIDGHLDRPGGSAAVFWNLQYLHPGDAVIVWDAHGKIFHFHVTHVASYAPQDAPLQGIFGTSGGIFLNLITCAGDWIASQHQTALRLVVYTTLD